MASGVVEKIANKVVLGALALAGVHSVSISFKLPVDVKKLPQVCEQDGLVMNGPNQPPFGFSGGVGSDIVSSVVKDSPAYRAGIVPGDRVLGYDNGEVLSIGSPDKVREETAKASGACKQIGLLVDHPAGPDRFNRAWHVLNFEFELPPHKAVPTRLTMGYK